MNISKPKKPRETMLICLLNGRKIRVKIAHILGVIEQINIMGG
jgi:hypothetical protein